MHKFIIFYLDMDDNGDWEIAHEAEERRVPEEHRRGPVNGNEIKTIAADTPMAAMEDWLDIQDPCHSEMVCLRVACRREDEGEYYIFEFETVIREVV